MELVGELNYVPHQLEHEQVHPIELIHHVIAPFGWHNEIMCLV